jgi:hypothetical protein
MRRVLCVWFPNWPIQRLHHAEPSLGGHPEVARVRVGVQHPGPARPGEEEVHVPPGRQVALGLAAGGDHPGERVAVEPLADDDVLGAMDDMGDVDLRIAVVGGRKGLLVVGLDPVVELLLHPFPQLIEDGLDLDAGDPRGRDPGDPADLLEVAHERLPGARVLDLDRDDAPVAPYRAVDLTDRRGGDRGVVEGGEPAPPPRAELLGEHGVDSVRGQRRGAVLELGEGGAVWAGDLLRQRRLEDRHRLAELHRPALELAERGEELLGGAGLQLRSDCLGRCAPDPAAQSPGRATGIPDGQRGQLGRPSHRLAGDVAHSAIVSLPGERDSAYADAVSAPPWTSTRSCSDARAVAVAEPCAEQCGCRDQRRCVRSGHGRQTSSAIPDGVGWPSR